jgi:hypothetical protein
LIINDNKVYCFFYFKKYEVKSMLQDWLLT